MSERGLGKNDVCRMARIAHTTLNSILNGGDTRLSTVEALANALGVTVSSMLTESAGSAIASGTKSAASYYGNVQMTQDSKYLELLLAEKDKSIAEKDKRIELLESIITDLRKK